MILKIIKTLPLLILFCIILFILYLFLVYRGVVKLVWFGPTIKTSGRVIKIYTGCYVDVVCSTTIETTKGENVTVSWDWGFSGCMFHFGQVGYHQDGEYKVGDTIEIYAAKRSNNELSICGNNKYYIRKIR